MWKDKKTSHFPSPNLQEPTKYITHTFVRPEQKQTNKKNYTTDQNVYQNDKF